jgi:hypothetical protein
LFRWLRRKRRSPCPLAVNRNYQQIGTAGEAAGVPTRKSGNHPERAIGPPGVGANMPDHGWTTIRLTRAGDHWEATQPDVAVTGSGDTPQWAAAEYCRKVAERHDRR